MAKILKINIYSMAKLQAILWGIPGLLMGIIYSIGGAIVDYSTIGLNWGTVLALLALPGMPLLFAVAGYLTGLLTAVMFNAVAGIFGGIDVNLTK